MWIFRVGFCVVSLVEWHVGAQMNACKGRSSGRFVNRPYRTGGNIVLSQRQMSANTVQTGGVISASRTVPSPTGLCGKMSRRRADCTVPKADGEGFIFGDFSAIFAVFGLARNGGVQPSKQSRRFDALTANLPSHPLSREFSRSSDEKRLKNARTVGMMLSSSTASGPPSPLGKAKAR